MKKNGDTDLRTADMEKSLPEGVIKKRGVNKKIIIAVILICAAAIGVWVFLTHHTFGGYFTTSTAEFDNSSNNSYMKFEDKILKYSRDGAVLLEEDGGQVWNQPYQMSDPVAVKNGESVVVADQGGNLIEIFGEEGVKGEIQTGLPIEKVAVSNQGITAAILSNDTSAKIICYDTAGNVLVEDQVSVAETGYPISVALSEDGCTLMVSYLLTENSGISSRLVYYDFSENTENQAEKAVAEHMVEDSVVPETFFMNDGISAAAGEGRLLIFSNNSAPDAAHDIKLDKEIHSVAHSGEYIGLVLENTEGKLPYELRVYNKDGKSVGSLNFKGDFSRMTLEGETVVLDAGTSCKLISVKGICMYDGALDEGAVSILPVRGLFKYAVMKNDGIQIIRLIK